MKSISTWGEIPDFASEAEEAQFWKEHELMPPLMKASEHVPDSRESTTITLRFDPRMLSRIKRIARERFLNYQSMMKQWLAERLEVEQRGDDR
ncbi:MAG: CopG family antitoxin [Roseibacillus sp.]|jgi:predicted DNA binding CopG/RHH family protein|nr:CopG family antitoxin [Roseibacillus sp.]